MKESSFRVILGLWLLGSLYFVLPVMTLALAGLLLFEGITNWRIPLVVSRLRGINTRGDRIAESACDARIPFEAERFLRLLVVLFLLASYLAFPQLLWWFPWFIGFALLGAGLSGICPLVLSLRWVGFQ